MTHSSSANTAASLPGPPRSLLAVLAIVLAASPELLGCGGGGGGGGGGEEPATASPRAEPATAGGEAAGPPSGQASADASDASGFPPETAPALERLPTEGDYELADMTVLASDCGATRFLYPDLSPEQSRFDVGGSSRDDGLFVSVFGPGEASTMGAPIAPNDAGEPVFRYSLESDTLAGDGDRDCTIHAVATVEGRVSGDDIVVLRATLRFAPPDPAAVAEGQTFDGSLCAKRLEEDRGVPDWDGQTCETTYRLELRRVAADEG